MRPWQPARARMAHLQGMQIRYVPLIAFVVMNCFCGSVSSGDHAGKDVQVGLIPSWSGTQRIPMPIPPTSNNRRNNQQRVVYPPISRPRFPSEDDGNSRKPVRQPNSPYRPDLRTTKRQKNFGGNQGVMRGQNGPSTGCVSDGPTGCNHNSSAEASGVTVQQSTQVLETTTAFLTKPVATARPQGSQKETITCSEHMRTIDFAWITSTLGNAIPPITDLKIMNCGQLHLNPRSFVSLVGSLRYLEIANVANLTLDQHAFDFGNDRVDGRSGTLKVNYDAFVDVGVGCTSVVSLTMTNVTFNAGAPFLDHATHCLKSIRIVDSHLKHLQRGAINGVVTEVLRIEKTSIQRIDPGAFSSIRTNHLEILGVQFGALEENSFTNISVLDTVLIEDSKFNNEIAIGAFNFGSPRHLDIHRNVFDVEKLGKEFIRTSVNASGRIENNYFGTFERKAFLGIRPAKDTAARLTLRGNIFKPATLEDITYYAEELLVFATSRSSWTTVSDTRLALKCSCSLFTSFGKRKAEEIQCGATARGDALESNDFLTQPTSQEVNLATYAERHPCFERGKHGKLNVIAIAAAASAVSFLVGVILCGACFLRRRRPRRSLTRSSLDASGTERSGWFFERMGRDNNGTMTSNGTSSSRLVVRTKSGRCVNYDNDGDSRRPSGNAPTIVYAIPETRVYQMSTAVDNFEMAEDIEDPVIIQPIFKDSGYPAGGASDSRGTMRTFGNKFFNTSQKSEMRRKSRAESDVFRLPHFAKGSAANSRRQSFAVDFVRKHQTLDF